MKPKIKVTDSVEFITDTPSLYFFDYKDASLSNLSHKDKLTKLSDEYVKEKVYDRFEVRLEEEIRFP